MDFVLKEPDPQVKAGDKVMFSFTLDDEAGAVITHLVPEATMTRRRPARWWRKDCTRSPRRACRCSSFAAIVIFCWAQPLPPVAG